jgi:glycosyltransferase involved in cell wall biosynthesis
LDLLLEAVCELQKRGIATNLMIAGDGPSRTDLDALANRLGIRGSVEFLGPIYDERRLSEIYSHSDISVVPAAAGLSVIHAMWYGVPVLTDDDYAAHGPEVEAIRESETGWFYRAGSSTSLADTLEEAARSDLARISLQCASAVRSRYTAEAQLQRMSDVIERVTSRS